LETAGADISREWIEPDRLLRTESDQNLPVGLLAPQILEAERDAFEVRVDSSPNQRKCRPGNVLWYLPARNLDTHIVRNLDTHILMKLAKLGHPHFYFFSLGIFPGFAIS
jgi:hypothetical protein